MAEIQKMSAEQLEASMKMIMHAGNAKSEAMEALNAAKNGDFKRAEEQLSLADDELIKAHNEQTTLLTDEASGEAITETFFAVHSQNHLMTSTVYNDLVKSIVDVYRMIYHNHEEEMDDGK